MYISYALLIYLLLYLLVAVISVAGALPLFPTHHCSMTHYSTR
jgi:hypothetical protein